jgi:hypothetical protein
MPNVAAAYILRSMEDVTKVAGFALVTLAFAAIMVLMLVTFLI